MPLRRARLSAMIGVADVVKLSDEDLNWLCPDAGTLQDKARRLLKRGPSLVIITEGAEGARAFLPGAQEIHVPAQKAEVVDTVGAGDTFNAGVLAALSAQGNLTKTALAGLSSADVSDCLAYAARVAAITVTRAGANAPWSHEL